MKDFEYGNYLYSLRKEVGLSQEALAKQLGITNKAISKWENGDAKPALAQLVKLADLFGVDLQQLVSKQTENKKKQIQKIVITGGPCAGKSTAMTWIQNEFTKKGWAVLFVPETATELILAGIAPWTMQHTTKFQLCVLKHQKHKEKLFEEAAHWIADAEKVLIVCDRGTMDGKSYFESESEFYKTLKQLNLKEDTLRDDYDAVFHLVTAAKGAEEFYTLSNNKARTETVEEAIEKDNSIISSWTGHPHLRIIDNSTDFKTKMQRLLSEISLFLGEPEPYEIERKYLIKYPSIKSLENDANCTKVEIIQTYLKSEDGVEMRVRQRGQNGSYLYTKTTKKQLSPVKRIEYEERISQDEYLNLLMSADTSCKQIRKTRYCLVYKNQYFEIDIYPFWKDKAIMEIELQTEDQEISFPPQIEIVKEVTNDKNYSKYALSKI